MIGEEKGSVAISGRSSHKMTGLSVESQFKQPWLQGTLQSLKSFFLKTAVRSCWTFFFSIPNIHREDRESNLYIQVIGQ